MKDMNRLTQGEFEIWKHGYNSAIDSAIHELRTPLQNLVDAIGANDQEKIKAALKQAKRGLSMYDPK